MNTIYDLQSKHGKRWVGASIDSPKTLTRALEVFYYMTHNRFDHRLVSSVNGGKKWSVIATRIFTDSRDETKPGVMKFAKGFKDKYEQAVEGMRR